MKTITMDEFRSYPMLKPGYKHVRKYGNSKIIKISDNFLPFLYELKKFKLQHFNTPIELIAVKDGYNTSYASISKFLKNYDVIGDLNINDYNTVDILYLFKNMLLSLEQANKKGLYINDTNMVNILVSKNLDYQFCDFDLAVINDLELNKRSIKTEIAFFKGYKHKLTSDDLKLNDCISIFNMLLSFLSISGKKLLDPYEIGKLNIIKQMNFPNNISNNLYDIYIKKKEPSYEIFIDMINDLINKGYEYKKQR